MTTFDQFGAISGPSWAKFVKIGQGLANLAKSGKMIELGQMCPKEIRAEPNMGYARPQAHEPQVSNMWAAHEPRRN